MIYQFRITHKDGQLPRHAWSVTGKKGAVELWGQFAAGEMVSFMGGAYGGIEVHSIADPNASNETSRKPVDCHLVEGGKCYPDGSSLAFDQWKEMVVSYKDEPSKLNSEIWRECLSWYENHLGADEPVTTEEKSDE